MLYRALLILIILLNVAAEGFATDALADLDVAWKKIRDQSWSNKTTDSLLKRIATVIPESHSHCEMINQAIVRRVDSIVEYCETRHTDPYRRAHAHRELLALELNLDSLKGRDFRNLASDDTRQEFFGELIDKINAVVDHRFETLKVSQRQQIQQILSLHIGRIRDDPLKNGHVIPCTQAARDALVSTFESSLDGLRNSETRLSTFHVAFTNATRSVGPLIQKFAELEPKTDTLPVIIDPFARSRLKGKVEFDEERSLFLVERLPLLKAVNREFTEAQKAERKAADAATEAKFAESQRRLEQRRRELQGE